MTVTTVPNRLMFASWQFSTDQRPQLLTPEIIDINNNRSFGIKIKSDIKFTGEGIGPAF